MLNNLEDLPEFKNSPFDGTTEVPIYEIALITYKPTTQDRFPYSPQEVLGIVGRFSDPTRIIITREWMKKTQNGGQIIATHSIGPHNIPIETISRYEVLVPHSEVTLPRSTRRIG